MSSDEKIPLGLRVQQLGTRGKESIVQKAGFHFCELRRLFKFLWKLLWLEVMITFHTDGTGMFANIILNVPHSHYENLSTMWLQNTTFKFLWDHTWLQDPTYLKGFGFSSLGGRRKKDSKRPIISPNLVISLKFVSHLSQNACQGLSKDGPASLLRTIIWLNRRTTVSEDDNHLGIWRLALNNREVSKRGGSPQTGGGLTFTDGQVKVNIIWQ